MIETINEMEKFLLDNNLSVFTFPQIETGEIFWLMKQPNSEAIGKGKTLLEAIKSANIQVRE